MRVDSTRWRMFVSTYGVTATFVVLSACFPAEEFRATLDATWPSNLEPDEVETLSTLVIAAAERVGVRVTDVEPDGVLFVEYTEQYGLSFNANGVPAPYAAWTLDFVLQDASTPPQELARTTYEARAVSSRASSGIVSTAVPFEIRSSSIQAELDSKPMFEIIPAIAD